MEAGPWEDVDVQSLMFKLTEEGKRLSSVNMCVEVNLDSTFPDSVDVLYANGGRATVVIKYPWMPLSCTHCKRFGHLTNHFPAHPQPSLEVLPEAVVTVGSPTKYTRGVEASATGPVFDATDVNLSGDLGTLEISGEVVDVSKIYVVI